MIEKILIGLGHLVSWSILYGAATIALIVASGSLAELDSRADISLLYRVFALCMVLVLLNGIYHVGRDLDDEAGEN